MNIKDVKDIHVKIREKYPPSDISPQALCDIVHILFEYCDKEELEKPIKTPDRCPICGFP